MNQKEICGTCKWHQHEDIDDSWVCVNGDSDYVTTGRIMTLGVTHGRNGNE